ncbi:MAG: nucleotidyltransferase domain-containing protein [Candidatus Aminicenantes bacterium]|nr:nucleotidyltransferase domain-containing protein [Candidatus Aminicenantes bacterium]
MKFHISLTNLINSDVKLKITKFLINHTASMSEREIAAVLNVSHMSVNRMMKELEDFNFVTKKVIGRTHVWQVNHLSYTFEFLSALVETIDTTPEPIEDLKKTILKSLPKEITTKVILFGSVSKAAEEHNSDIDIFILVKNQRQKKAIAPSIEELSLKCLERFGNVLSPYILTENELRQKKHLALVSVINSGTQIFPA